MFNTQDVLDTAGRNIAPRPPTSLGETFGTSLDVTSDATSTAIREQLRGEYRRYRDEISKQTGIALPDPFEPSTEREMRDLRREDPEALSARDIRVKRFHTEVERLRRAYPDIPVRSHEDILDAVAAERQKRREARLHAARGESGLMSGLTAFAGGMVGGMNDPVVMLSLPFGAPWASGVIRAGLIEAGVGIASETAVQAFHQSARRELGEEPSVSEALANIATVGAGAGVLGAGIRLGAAGFRALRRRRLEVAESIEAKSPELDAAVAVERRTLEAEEANPFSDTPHGRALHAEKLEDATRALTEEKVLRDEGGLEPAQLSAAAQAVEELSDTERAALRTAAERMSDPLAFEEFVRSIRRPPQPQGKRLLTFLRSAGGLKDEAGELRTVGVTPRTRPGLISRKGLTLDEAGEKATEEGFFVERPTTSELVDAIREDFSGTPQFADAGAAILQREARALTELADALSRSGVDVFQMTPQEARHAVQRLATGLEELEGPPIAETKARGAAAVDFDELERSFDLAEPADIENQVRELYAGREDTPIVVETDEGEVTRLTVREMFDDFKREEDELKALQSCVTG